MDLRPFQYHTPNDISVHGSLYFWPSQKWPCPVYVNIRKCANKNTIWLVQTTTSSHNIKSTSSSSFDHGFHSTVDSTSFNWINNIVWPMFMFVRTSAQHMFSTDEMLWKSQFVFGQQLFFVCLSNCEIHNKGDQERSRGKEKTGAEKNLLLKYIVLSKHWTLGLCRLKENRIKETGKDMPRDEECFEPYLN